MYMAKVCLRIEFRLPILFLLQEIKMSESGRWKPIVVFTQLALDSKDW